MAWRLGALALLALMSVGCGPAIQPASQPASQPGASPAGPPPVPDASRAETFAGCTWGEVQSGGVSVWSFSCPQDRLVADPALPGFVREVDGPDGVLRASVIALFAKAADAPLTSVLPQVRAASPGAQTATCDFEELAGEPGAWLFMPTGAARAAYDALIAPGSDATEPTEADFMPCGAWGPSESGQRVFRVVPGAEDTVAGINLGSEITIFDPSTLRASR